MVDNIYLQKMNGIKEALEAKRAEAAELEKDMKVKGEAFSSAQTGKKVSDFAKTRNKINKIWLILVGVGCAFALASVIISLYWQKSPDVHNFYEGFTYNGEPIFLLGVGAVLIVIGVIFFIAKMKSRREIAEKSKLDDQTYAREKEIYEDAKRRCENAASEVKKLEEELKAAENEYLEHDPEEKKRREEEKKRLEEEAKAEMRRIEEINAKAEAESKKRAQDRLEADKMFEHPQAYVLDGKFENEYEVYVAAADLGSPDAQERVVCYMLGILYRSGVKPDVEKGVKLALRYAEEGNNAMYELLGKGYLYGEGELPKDEEKGLFYLEKASTKGRQNAMIMAGICHYNGVGTEKDEQKARTFFAKAAKQGNEQAIKVVAAIDRGERLRF